MGVDDRAKFDLNVVMLPKSIDSLAYLLNLYIDSLAPQLFPEVYCESTPKVKVNLNYSYRFLACDNLDIKSRHAGTN